MVTAMKACVGQYLVDWKVESLSRLAVCFSVLFRRLHSWILCALSIPVSEMRSISMSSVHSTQYVDVYLLRWTSVARRLSKHHWPHRKKIGDCSGVFGFGTHCSPDLSCPVAVEYSVWNWNVTIEAEKSNPRIKNPTIRPLWTCVAGKFVEGLGQLILEPWVVGKMLR